MINESSECKITRISRLENHERCETPVQKYEHLLKDKKLDYLFEIKSRNVLMDFLKCINVIILKPL